MATVSVSRNQISDGSLPSVCVVCGEEASHRLFPGMGAPSLAWVIVSPLLGLLTFWVYILFAGGSPREGGLPFCNRHRGYWTWRAWFVVVGFAVLIGLTVAACALPPSGTPGRPTEVLWLLKLAVLWLLVFLPAFLVIHLTATRPIGGDRDRVVLSGASQQFADALKQGIGRSDPGPAAHRRRQ
jgi:hypothetical protein